MPTPPNERFWSKVEKTVGCWIWKGRKTARGYGEFWMNSDRGIIPAHRAAYELIVGKVPDGLTLDHLCKNKACVNPDHLEPVTNRENLLRGGGTTSINAKKTHCPKGHPLIEGNLVPSYLEYGQRTCLTCYREKTRVRSKKYAERNKQGLTIAVGFHS